MNILRGDNSVFPELLRRNAQKWYASSWIRTLECCVFLGVGALGSTKRVEAGAGLIFAEARCVLTRVGTNSLYRWLARSPRDSSPHCIVLDVVM